MVSASGGGASSAAAAASPRAARGPAEEVVGVGGGALSVRAAPSAGAAACEQLADHPRVVAHDLLVARVPQQRHRDACRREGGARLSDRTRTLQAGQRRARGEGVGACGAPGTPRAGRKAPAARPTARIPCRRAAPSPRRSARRPRPSAPRPAQQQRQPSVTPRASRQAEGRMAAERRAAACSCSSARTARHEEAHGQTPETNRW